MLPQPPPDAPAPPPSQAALLSQRKWKWLWIIGLGSAAAFVLWFFAAPLIFRSRRLTEQTRAISNARQIGLALFEFEAKYGSFPDTGTIATVQKMTGTDLKLGTKSSNDFFRQLIASGIAQSEGMFYAKGAGVRKPDNVFTGTKALGKGECGFTYIVGPTLGDWNQPILVAPLISGTDRFDPKPFNGAAIVVRVDGSVQMLKMDRRGQVRDFSNRNILDPSNPVWNGKPPVILWPDL